MTSKQGRVSGFLAAVVGLALIAFAQPVGAKERKVTFAVQNMTCASCPFIVKSAMKAVEGVREVAVDFEAKTATVTFDDTRTSVDAIAKASADHGYPAHALKDGSANGAQR